MGKNMMWLLIGGAAVYFGMKALRRQRFANLTPAQRANLMARRKQLPSGQPTDTMTNGAMTTEFPEA